MAIYYLFLYDVFKVQSPDLSGSGDEGIRTPDPLLARQVLSQLSYTPIFYMVMFFHQLLSSLCSLRSLMCLRLDSNFALARSHQVLWLWA